MFNLGNLDKNQTRVWCRGDECQVHWSGDGDLYPATIKKIIRRPGGKQTSLVSFEGFGSEDDEEVDLSDLIATPSKRIEKRGETKTANENTEDDDFQKSSSRRPEDAERERLRRKFEMLDREEELETLRSPPTPRPSWKTTSKRLVDDRNTVDTSSSKKTPASTPKQKVPTAKKEETPKSASTSTTVKRKINSTSHSAKFQFTDSESEGDSDADRDKETNNHSGFEDEDFEKPRFSRSGNSPKVPLLLSKEDDKKVCVPATINQYLWEYQREGVRFLYDHYRQGHGAILGDDMGLGKTVQVIAFISALLRKKGNKEDVLKQRPKFIRKMSSEPYDDEDEDEEKKVYLIVGPASVLYNWVDELETWGHFTVGKFHKHYKEQAMADLKREKLDIVVTTFETCRDNIDILNRFRWDAVIADEAHKIKGMKAETTQALKALNCRRRFGLTGTALQNHMKELWCILDWANPGCLGNVTEFEVKFEKVILEGQKQDATKRQLAQARKAKENFSELRNQWFLRRTKAIIAEQLPKKEEQVVYCRPTPFQVDVYKAILCHPHIGIILTRNDPCPCKSGLKRSKCHYKKSDDGRTVNQLLFSYLQLLLKTANHVALLIPKKTSNENQRKQAEEICDLVFERHPQFRNQQRAAAFRTLSDPKYCGKMKVMAGLLKVFKKEKSKVLLFSLSTQLLDIIEHYVTTTGYEYRRLDGQTPDVRRVKLVHEFNRDPSIFLMLSSTRAGGVGLNMTGANVVIIYDPNWNPTHDLQAQDRVYRLGQSRDVRVYRLITMGTVEENIYLRQVYKQQLDRVAVSEENAKRLFHRDEIFGLDNLFKLRTSESCLTVDILERNAKIETSIRGFHIQKYIAPRVEDTNEYETSEMRSGMRGRQRNDKKHDVEYLCDSEIIDDSDEEDRSDVDSEDDDGIYGEDVTDADDMSTSRQKRLHRRSRVVRSDSDSEDGLPCGQPPPQGKTSPADSREDSASHDDSAHKRPSRSKGRCKECLQPTAGTSRTTGRHTCGTEGRTPSQEKRVYKRVMAKSGVKHNHAMSESSDEEGGQKKVRHSPVPDTAKNESVAFGSVSDVFDQCKVAHRHENNKLVGASRAEDHMTRCAMQDVYELHQFSQAPAVYCQPLSDSGDESDDLGSKPQAKQKAAIPRSKGKREPTKKKGTTHRAMMIDKLRVLIGQTPTAIRKKQFKEMATILEEEDVVAFAKKVVRCSDKSRQSFLRQFYKEKDPVLEGAFVEEDEEEHEDDEGKKNTPCKQPHKDENKRKVAPRRRQRTREHSAGKKGCDYTSGSGSEPETAKPKKRTVRNVKADGKRGQRQGGLRPNRGTDSETEGHSDPHPPEGTKAQTSTKKGAGKDTDSLRETQSNNTAEKLLDELFESDGEEKRKSAPRTPRNPKPVPTSSAVKQDCPKACAGKAPDTVSKISILDGLFDDDDDVVVRKAPPKRKGPSQQRDHGSDSEEDLFPHVSPAKRAKQTSKPGFSADSLDTFVQECKVTIPVLNATVDEDFLYEDSEDDMFSDSSKWKKNPSKRSGH